MNLKIKVFVWIEMLLVAEILIFRLICQILSEDFFSVVNFSHFCKGSLRRAIFKTIVLSYTNVEI